MLVLCWCVEQISCTYISHLGFYRSSIVLIMHIIKLITGLTTVFMLALCWYGWVLSCFLIRLILKNWDSTPELKNLVGLKAFWEWTIPALTSRDDVFMMPSYDQNNCVRRVLYCSSNTFIISVFFSGWRIWHLSTSNIDSMQTNYPYKWSSKTWNRVSSSDHDDVDVFIWSSNFGF